MVNEEKAKEIARINKEYYESGSCRCVSSEEECYDSAIEMAKWKDEQAKNKKEEFIDKAVGWLKNNIHDYYMTCEFEEWFDDMFDDFRNAMKDK